jgi:hypothetical protein
LLPAGELVGVIAAPLGEAREEPEDLGERPAVASSARRGGGDEALFGCKGGLEASLA